MKKPVKKLEKKSGAPRQRLDKKKGAGTLTQLDRLEDRRTKIMSMLGRGALVTDIAKTLKVSRQSVYNDLHAIGIEEQDKMKDNANFIARLSSETTALKRAAWDVFDKECSYINKKGKKKTVPILRLGALREIREISRNHADVLIKLGTLTAAPEKTEGKFIVSWMDPDSMKVPPIQPADKQLKLTCANCGSDKIESTMRGVPGEVKCAACGKIGEAKAQAVDKVKEILVCGSCGSEDVLISGAHPVGVGCCKLCGVTGTLKAKSKQ